MTDLTVIISAPWGTQQSFNKVCGDWKQYAENYGFPECFNEKAAYPATCYPNHQPIDHKKKQSEGKYSNRYCKNNKEGLNNKVEYRQNQGDPQGRGEWDHFNPCYQPGYTHNREGDENKFCNGAHHNIFISEW